MKRCRHCRQKKKDSEFRPQRRDCSTCELLKQKAAYAAKRPRSAPTGGMVLCNECGRRKHPTAFYKHRRVCKTCYRIREKRRHRSGQKITAVPTSPLPAPRVLL